MSWQPIDSAPKDGTCILAYGHGTHKSMWPANDPMPPMQCVIWWSWHDDFIEQDAGDGLYRKVPARVLEMWQPLGPHWFYPTHWQPLPESPA